MKTIVVLLDTLNRRMLTPYHPTTHVKTPNINRFAQKSIVFEQHWAGSLPCMPARRDLMTGRLDFLERGWGALEPFDITLPEKLRERNIFSHICTDHYHYFETGGENYCQAFNTWDFHRGQEADPWVSRVQPPEKPSEFYGRVVDQYESNRSTYWNEEDYSGPRTMMAACKWLEENHDADQFFLMVEAFDPHEPFDCPKDYLEQYEDRYTGPRFDWPVYGPVNEPAEAVEHIRKRYAGTLSMIDQWFGKLLAAMDSHRLWDDTLVILTTDHGFLLGERDLIGKNYPHVFNELAHIPLMIHLPGGASAGRRVQAITQNIDMMPTILDYYGIACPEAVTGKSLRGIMEGREERTRDYAIYGYHGRTANITDGRFTYLRAPLTSDNGPCFHYTAMPTTMRRYMGRDVADQIECGRFLGHVDFPVFRIPSNRPANMEFISQSLLFDLSLDYDQQYPVRDDRLEQHYVDALAKEMKRIWAPEEQFTRLGLPT